MAKAVFHKAQRVYVKPVGTHAIIERVVPHWVDGEEEPIRVTYDVGLGREFTASELTSEDTLRAQATVQDLFAENWRVLRQRNRWYSVEDTAAHPYPGTHPAIVSDELDWGGWRVSCSEYNRDPSRIEYQARMIANAPDLVRISKRLVQTWQREPDRFTDEMEQAVRRASLIIRHVYGVTDQPEMAAE
ncbi:MAG: hypothetical protein AAGJ84_12055 [Pseudomonadota bacterium]